MIEHDAYSSDSNDIDKTVGTAEEIHKKHGYTDGTANNVGKNDNKDSEIIIRCEPEELTYGNSIYHHESAYVVALHSKESYGVTANTLLKIVSIG